MSCEEGFRCTTIKPASVDLALLIIFLSFSPETSFITKKPALIAFSITFIFVESMEYLNL